MKKLVMLWFVIAVAAFFIFTDLAWSTEFPAKIIKAEWLKENMDKIPNLKIVDLRPAEEYAKEHIPGAVNLPYKELRVTVMNVPEVRRPQEDWEKMMGQRLGIDDTNAIVVYTDKQIEAAGRFVWECDYYGHEKVALVNGGFDAWVKVGGKVSKEMPKINPIFYAVRKINSELLATNHFIMKHLKDPQYVLIDTRPFQQYSGAQPGALIKKRGGHIPGAINIPLGKFVNDGYLISPKELEALLESKGIKKDKIIILTCRTGNQTGGPYPLLSTLGYRVTMHDYSWVGWNEEDYLPGEK